jgi:hypothetical protein
VWQLFSETVTMMTPYLPDDERAQVDAIRSSVCAKTSRPMHRPFLLLAPTLSESAPIRAAVADGLARGELELSVCGIGQMCATSLCERLDRTGWLGCIALIGWAGGLRPDLAAGDIVLADAALNAQGQCAPCTPVSLPGARVGALLSVPAPLLTPQAKRTATSCGALAVEMEAYPLAAWACAHHLPFIHARVILDTVNEALPDLGDALDAVGRVRPGRLAARLLARPGLALDVLHFVRRMKRLDPILGMLAHVIFSFESAVWPP